MNRKIKGTAGEQLAFQYLARSGWKIFARNYRVAAGELDIVAREPSGILVFVEVKALSSYPNSIHSLIPEDHLDFRKLSKLRILCTHFANRYPHLVQGDRGWRIDLIAMDLGSKTCLRHYENIG